MKRMSAMVLSTICIMNALASPVATAFADTNGYELVDLSANSDKLMGAGLAEEETASPSTIAEESESSDDISEEMLGDLEQYREYLNDEKTKFKDGNGLTVEYNSFREQWFYYSDVGFDEIPYTHQMEVDAARKVYRRNQLQGVIGDFKSYLNGLSDFRGGKVLDKVCEVDAPSFRNYTKGDRLTYGSYSFGIDGLRKQVSDFVKDAFPNIDNFNDSGFTFYRLDTLDGFGTDGTFVNFSGSVGGTSYSFWMPVKSKSEDLDFADGSLEKMTIHFNESISDSDLNTIVSYLKETRRLKSLDVFDSLVKYDEAGKFYYVDANYQFEDSDDVIHGKIRFSGEGSFGFLHHKNLYVDYAEGKTELTDEDVERINSQFKDVKDNILSGFDVNVYSRSITVNNSIVNVTLVHNAPRFLNMNCSAMFDSRPIDDGTGIISRYAYSVKARFKHDFELYSFLNFDDLKDKDLYVRGSMLYDSQVAGGVNFRDFVKSKNGGFEVDTIKYIDKGRWQNDSDALIVASYDLPDGLKGYYVVKVNADALSNLNFGVSGTAKPSLADDALKNRVVDVLLDKYGSGVSDIRVSDVIDNGTITFTLLDASGIRRAGSVNLIAPDVGLPSLSCPPVMILSPTLMWYDNKKVNTPHYDDDGYTPKKDEEPKPSKPEEPVSPSEIEKPSEPGVPKNEEPAPSKPVVPVSPSEIEKPVNPPVTPDKPSVPVSPKPSVPDSAKPIEKATPSNITPSSDRPNRNDSVRPTPSKPSVPQGNDSVTITKVNESEELSKDKSVAGVDRLNGNVRGEFRNTPLQSDSKPVTIGNPISRNVRTGDMSLAIVFGALAMVNAFGLGFYFWKMNKQLED